MAGNRCESCGKLASLTFPEEVEIGDEEFDQETGHYSFTARIVRSSECCGYELKEATLEVEGDVNLEAVYADDPSLRDEDLEMEIEAECSDRTEGKGRGMKTFFVVSGTVTIKRPGLGRDLLTDEWKDEIQASHMDEI